MGDWLIDILRSILLTLDRVVYSCISLAYTLFMDIANTTVFSEDIIDLFASKVYALLGIFMLFKVSFSILTYIVNPDDFTDKSKGFSKLISNIVITLVLLVSTPWIFSQAMDIQRIVLRDNIIGKVFSTGEVSNVTRNDAGEAMAFETIRAFYHFDLDADGAEVCKGLASGKIYQETSNNGDSSLESCENYLGSETFKKMSEFMEISYITKNTDYYLGATALNLKNAKDEYVMSYLPIISTIVGGVVCWLLLMFCMDVAMRSVQLGFLRMIAPIPIISRIDPKKGTDMFNKWVKKCTSVYLSLFIRLLAIYFAIFVITQVI